MGANYNMFLINNRPKQTQLIMYRIVIMSGKAFGKEVNENISFDSDGQTLANEGNIVIYADSIEEIEKQLGLEVQMV